MEMENENNKKKVRELEVGEVVEFPIEKMNNIRTYAYEIGVKEQKKFKTEINKEKRTITIIRTE